MKKSIKEVAVKLKSISNDKAHVIPRHDGWVVKKEGAVRASGIYPTKNEAVKGAEKFLSSGSVKRVVVHKKDGTIEKWKK